MIVDTHAHIYYPEILDQLDAVLSRARDAGVEKIIAPAVDLETSRTIIRLSEKYDMLYCAIGIHPCDVSKNEFNSVDEIEKLIDHEKVVAIGETGLDYYWDTSSIDKQKTFFRLQIDLAKSHNLPIVIHTRSSIDDAIDMISENYDSDLRGQFHCFSGNVSQLERILSMENFYVSFCGNITYKNFNETDVVKQVPTDRILSETDSPFLPPVPYRGKKNEPSYITHTLKKIADVKGLENQGLLRDILKNVNKLFF